MSTDINSNGFDNYLSTNDEEENESSKKQVSSQSLLKKEEQTVINEVHHGTQEINEHAFADTRQDTVKANQTMEEIPILVESVATQQEVFNIPNNHDF